MSDDAEEMVCTTPYATPLGQAYARQHALQQSLDLRHAARGGPQPRPMEDGSAGAAGAPHRYGSWWSTSSASSIKRWPRSWRGARWSIAGRPRR